jgi:hypothetical protein
MFVVQSLEPSHAACKLWNDPTTVEKSLVDPRTVKERNVHKTQQTHPWVFAQENWKQRPEKYLHVNVQRNTIHNCERWKPPMCPPADEGINKSWYSRMMEYYLAIKEVDCVWLKTLC